MTPSPPPVLLNVDDNEIARYTRSRTLRHAGFEVLEADCGGSELYAYGDPPPTGLRRIHSA